jgi:hypothetical protein
LDARLQRGANAEELFPLEINMPFSLDDKFGHVFLMSESAWRLEPPFSFDEKLEEVFLVSERARRIEFCLHRIITYRGKIPLGQALQRSLLGDGALQCHLHHTQNVRQCILQQ